MLQNCTVTAPGAVEHVRIVAVTDTLVKAAPKRASVFVVRNFQHWGTPTALNIVQRNTRIVIINDVTDVSICGIPEEPQLKSMEQVNGAADHVLNAASTPILLKSIIS